MNAPLSAAEQHVLEKLNPSDINSLWEAFADSTDASDFATAWLQIQSISIPGTRHGVVIVRDGTSDSFAPLALWPATAELSHLGEIAQKALMQRRGIVEATPPESKSPPCVQIAYPIEAAGQVAGVVVLEIDGQKQEDITNALRQLHWGSAWIANLFMARLRAEQAAKVDRSHDAFQLVAACLPHKKFEPCAVHLVNELESRLRCDRVSLGIEKNGSIIVKHIARTAVFQKQAKLILDTERAMNEALDQRAAIQVPTVDESQLYVHIAHKELAAAYPAACILSVPLMVAGGVIAVVTLERHRAEAFTEADREICSLTASLLAPTISERLAASRPLPIKAMDWCKGSLKSLFGPRRLAWKLGSLAVVATIAFLALFTTTYRVSADTVIEGEIQLAASAPFDGFIAEAPARAGHTVKKGQLLARLEDRDLRLERSRLLAERLQQDRRLRDAMGRDERAEMRIASAQLDQANAQLALVEQKLQRTRIVAAMDGIVVSGDLSQMIGSPVQEGKALFEIAPLERYRVILKADERFVHEIAKGQSGHLVFPGLVSTQLPLQVSSVTPVATTEEGKNFFRVEATLEQADARLRPGMQGLAKVEVGERSLLWIWTHSFFDWVRYNTWAWLN